MAPNTFFLRESLVNSVCDVNEDISARTHSKRPLFCNGHQSNQVMSFLQATEKVLDSSADRKPMHYKDITNKALEQGLMNTSGKTPEATINAQLVTELKRVKASGEPGNFVRSSPGYYGLAKWMGTGLSAQILKHNREVHKILRCHSWK